MPPLADVLKRLDQKASQFRNMSAKAASVDHTAVLNSDDPESGTVFMKKTGGSVQGLMNTVLPDPKTSVFSGREVQIYYPNMKRVDIYDTGKNGEQLEQFLTLGFGTSAADLQKTYDIKVLPTENIQSEKTVHLQLIPKSEDARKMISKVELWIGEHDYPIQEKIYEPSGNYHLVSYSDVQINSPSFKDQDVQLKRPPGVKDNRPGKQ
ncbi:MAG: outer membrane lipoprotein carrier protein LolA [Bryobacteraceae bacterium]